MASLLTAGLRSQLHLMQLDFLVRTILGKPVWVPFAMLDATVLLTAKPTGDAIGGRFVGAGTFPR